MDIDGTKNHRPTHTVINLMYPAIYTGEKTTVEIGMFHVRAADSIRISYESGRDGWVIEQASTFEWSVDDEVCDPDWQEVAFVKAWAREKPSDL